jgi:ABC-2 type transport system permease protein
MFLITTVLMPLAIAIFGLAPALVMSIQSGAPLRVAVVDRTGKLFGPLKSALQVEEGTLDAAAKRDPMQPDFVLEELKNEGSEEQLTQDIERRLTAKEVVTDAVLIIPKDVMDAGTVQFYRRNTSDLFSTRRIQNALVNVIRERRLIDAHVDRNTMTELARPVNFETTRISGSGSERDSGGGFALVFGVGFVMYITVLLYGQVVLGAVIEEKETRIAEVLFASVKPFTLMMGKLLGVSLVALTQLAIWGLAFTGLALYGVNLLASRGVPTNIPNIPFIFYIYFVVFFLVGYFVYATLYALLGSVVTTAQEGGQAAMPIIMLLVISFYLFLPVSRNPDSSLSFWLSMIPFFAPISMLVRIVTQTPPFWQILLSLLIGLTSATLLTWVASKIYRVGMLMYGKRPTIPEVLRWVRQ